MFTIILNTIALLLNLFILLPLAVAQTQEPGHQPPALKCFDEKYPPPSIAGGLDLIITDSATAIVNPHPEKKGWNIELTENDFKWRDSIPDEIVQVKPDILSWISVSWKGWWEVGCSVEPISEKEVLVTVHYFGFSSGAWFLQDQSGRVVAEMGEELLRHEQGHFDIVELGRRRWQDRADSADQKLIEMAEQKQFKPLLSDFAPNDQASISKKTRRMIEQLANQEGLRDFLRELARYKWIDTGWAEGVTDIYETETNYGTNKRAQERWGIGIWEMLGGK